MPRPEIGWAGLVAMALVGFLLLAGTANQVTAHEAAAATAGFILAGVCVLLGRRQRHGGRSAVLLGSAVGAICAVTAALLKALTMIALHSPIPLLTSWQLYAVLILGAGGLLLNQVAFQAGPLSASLPAITTVDPLLSIGVVVYDERIRHGPPAGIGLGGLLLILGGAVIALARAETSSPAPMQVGHHRIMEDS